MQSFVEHNASIWCRAARDIYSFGDHLGIDQDVVSQTHGHAIESALHWGPQIAELALTGDDRRYPRETRRDDAQDVAVEIEGMDEPDPVAVKIADQPPHGQGEARGLERPSPAARDREPGRLDPRAQRSDGTEAGQVDVPPGSIEPAGDLHELALGSTSVQLVADEENSGTRGHHAAPTSPSRRSVRSSTSSAQSRLQYSCR